MRYVLIVDYCLVFIFDNERNKRLDSISFSDCGEKYYDADLSFCVSILAITQERYNNGTQIPA